jgi:hypothetical protein
MPYEIEEYIRRVFKLKEQVFNIDLMSSPEKIDTAPDEMDDEEAEEATKEPGMEEGDE